MVFSIYLSKDSPPGAQGAALRTCKGLSPLTLLLGCRPNLPLAGRRPAAKAAGTQEGIKGESVKGCPGPNAPAVLRAQRTVP